MALYKFLKSIWKKLGVKGQVKNFSSVELWTLDTESGLPVAHRLPPGYKSPISIDIDAFKRIDGLAIESHDNWWKFYDFSTPEIYDQGKSISVSTVSKTAVDESHFGKVTYLNKVKGSRIQVVTDVKRDKNEKITAYFVTELGWVSLQKALELTCRHKIDNARPVFPKNGTPYIRTRRDPELYNNLSAKGLV
jgi:hypothetical protein